MARQFVTISQLPLPRRAPLLAVVLSIAAALPLAGFADRKTGGLDLSPQLRDRCLAVLREGFNSDEFWPSMHAAEGLTLAGRQEEVLAMLGERLKAETDDAKRCGPARELIRAGDR